MKPSAPESEDTLQQLIADFPEIVSGNDESLLLIKREASVPDTMDGGNRWSLDHLFVTSDAIPVLVEVKRATDTRLRREVIGQLLDYAANGVAYWGEGTLRQIFENTCNENGIEPDILLSDFIGDVPKTDFWNQIDANLAAGNIRLVIVADVIPAELARIIEFLNEQMSATINAIELRYFESEDGSRTLVPRLIGESERTAAAKGRRRGKLEPISFDDWFAKHIAPKGKEISNGAKAHLTIVQKLGAKVEVAATQGSILCTLVGVDGSAIYPLFLNKDGRVSIGFAWLLRRDKMAEAPVREAFLEDFASAVGELSTSNAKGHPAFPVDRLNDPVVLTKYTTVVGKYFERLKASSVISRPKE